MSRGVSTNGRSLSLGGAGRSDSGEGSAPVVDDVPKGLSGTDIFEAISIDDISAPPKTVYTDPNQGIKHWMLSRLSLSTDPKFSGTPQLVAGRSSGINGSCPDVSEAFFSIKRGPFLRRPKDGQAKLATRESTDGVSGTKKDR